MSLRNKLRIENEFLADLKGCLGWETGRYGNTSGLLGVVCWVGSGSARDAEEVGIEELLLLERQHFEYKELAGCWCQDRSLALEAEVAVSRTTGNSELSMPLQVFVISHHHVLHSWCWTGLLDRYCYQKMGDTSTFIYTYGKGWR